MQKLSRVKKYEELRKSIELDNNINSASNNDDNQAKELLHSFDASVLKKADIQENSNFGKREKIEEPQNQTSVSSDDTFTNEYLDDFLKEVRDYNIRKGTRQCEDTEVDILYQLNNENRAKRNRYAHEIKDDENYRKNNSNTVETVLSKEQIAEEVKNLIFDEVPAATKETEEVSNETKENLEKTEETIVEPSETEQDKPLDSIEETIEVSPIIEVQEENHEEQLEEQDEEDSTDEVEEDETENQDVEEENENQQATFHQKFIEETQQIRVQMNEYEDELTDLSDGVEKTNKLLNFVLGFLILVLLIVIGFIGYSIWRLGGF